MNNALFIPVQLAIIILLAPLVNGINKKVKAFSQKRKGPPLLQFYFDLYKLLRKDTVVSETSSWVFKAAPYLTLVTALVASLFVPVTSFLQPFSFRGDIILAIYTLALGRFFMTLAALDTGSTFGGMGSSREMMVASLIEPALLVAVITLGLISGSTSVSGMMQNNLLNPDYFLQPVNFLLFAAIFIVLLAETASIPVDDPATHLELTMVHEAMILEYSGRYLAMMELAASVKQLFFLTLLANLFLPPDILINTSNVLGSVALGLVFYFLKVIFLTLLLSLVEISTVKLRFFSVPNLAAISFALAFLGFIQHFIIGR